MSPWVFLLSIVSAYVGLVIGFHFVDRWAESRARDRRIKEWNEMVRKNQEKKDWATRTYRDPE